MTNGRFKHFQFTASSCSKFSATIALCFISLIFKASQLEAVSCPDADWTVSPGGNRCIKRFDFGDDLKESWKKGMESCYLYGTPLATIHNEEENALIRSIVADEPRGCWVGLRDYKHLKTKKGWLWVDRIEALTQNDFTSWGPELKLLWRFLPPDERCVAATPYGWIARPCWSFHSKLSCYVCATLSDVTSQGVKTAFSNAIMSDKWYMPEDDVNREPTFANFTESDRASNRAKWEEYQRSIGTLLSPLHPSLLENAIDNIIAKTEIEIPNTDKIANDLVGDLGLLGFGDINSDTTRTISDPKKLPPTKSELKFYGGQPIYSSDFTSLLDDTLKNQLPQPKLATTTTTSTTRTTTITTSTTPTTTSTTPTTTSTTPTTTSTTPTTTTTTSTTPTTTTTTSTTRSTTTTTSTTPTTTSTTSTTPTETTTITSTTKRTASVANMISKIQSFNASHSVPLDEGEKSMDSLPGASISGTGKVNNEMLDNDVVDEMEKGESYEFDTTSTISLPDKSESILPLQIGIAVGIAAVSCLLLSGLGLAVWRRTLDDDVEAAISSVDCTPDIAQTIASASQVIDSASPTDSQMGSGSWPDIENGRNSSDENLFSPTAVTARSHDASHGELSEIGSNR